MGLNKDHFQRYAEHLTYALAETKVDAGVIALFLERIGGWRDCILCLGEWA